LIPCPPLDALGGAIPHHASSRLWIGRPVPGRACRLIPAVTCHRLAAASLRIHAAFRGLFILIIVASIVGIATSILISAGFIAATLIFLLVAAPLAHLGEELTRSVAYRFIIRKCTHVTPPAIWTSAVYAHLQAARDAFMKKWRADLISPIIAIIMIASKFYIQAAQTGSDAVDKILGIFMKIREAIRK